jgi:hypothetical protein
MKLLNYGSVGRGRRASVVSTPRTRTREAASGPLNPALLHLKNLIEGRASGLCDSCPLARCFIRNLQWAANVFEGFLMCISLVALDIMIHAHENRGVLRVFLILSSASCAGLSRPTARSTETAPSPTPSRPHLRPQVQRCLQRTRCSSCPRPCLEAPSRRSEPLEPCSCMQASGSWFGRRSSCSLPSPVPSSERSRREAPRTMAMEQARRGASLISHLVCLLWNADDSR